MSAPEFAARRRSWLFAPGNRPAIMAKAVSSKAQAIILDLEDAVPYTEKSLARDTVVDQISRLETDKPVYVRTNALDTPFALEDLRAVAGLPITGIVLPKSDDAEAVRLAAWVLAQTRPAGLAQITIVPLIETAKGLANVREIAQASEQIQCLAFGAGDFTLDMNLQWSRDETELLGARLEIVLASRLGNLAAPVDAVWVEIGDESGMAQSALRSRFHGFQGKMCIHPRQVDAVLAAFLPDAEEVVRALRIISAFDEAGGGIGAAIQVDGKMVDYPIFAAARQLIAEHDLMGETTNLREST